MLYVNVQINTCSLQYFTVISGFKTHKLLILLITYSNIDKSLIEGEDIQA